jgi:hypothetical protein
MCTNKILGLGGDQRQPCRQHHQPEDKHLQSGLCGRFPRKQSEHSGNECCRTKYPERGSHANLPAGICFESNSIVAKIPDGRNATKGKNDQIYIYIFLNSTYITSATTATGMA